MHASFMAWILTCYKEQNKNNYLLTLMLYGFLFSVEPKVITSPYYFYFYFVYIQ